MKKLSFVIAILPMLFCACSSSNEDNGMPIIPIISELQAGFADDTRTYVEDSKYLRWHEDDRLTAFYGNTLNRQYKFNGRTGDNSGTFSLVPSGELGTGNAFDRIYALYPYDETATITEEGVISLTLPAVQQYGENSFGKGANTMIAVTENIDDTFLAFKNACGYLKLKLYSPAGGVIVKRIEVKGNNNEMIAGRATATIEFGKSPMLNMAEGAITTIELNCGDGLVLGNTEETATEFWIAIPEVLFTKGITFTVYDIMGRVFQKTTSKEITITRNTIQPMAELAVYFGSDDKIPNNQIWYAATERIIPYDIDVFGASLLTDQSTYDSVTQKGVLVFDSSVTSIGKNAFKDCVSLQSITIPNLIENIGDHAFSGCSNLKIATFGEKVSSIGASIFTGCGELTEITFLNEYLFSFKYGITGTPKLRAINSVFSSEDKRCLVIDGELVAFAPYGLTEYTFPYGITKIPSLNDNYLNSFIVPETCTEIGSCGGCMALNEEFIVPLSVTTLGGYAFYKNKTLKRVIIPYTLKNVGWRAFMEIENLVSATIYCEKISEQMFEGCKKLSNVVLDNTTEIGMGAFAYCKSITSIDIPETVNAIWAAAFSNCLNLKEVFIHNPTPPEAVLYFNMWQAFYYCGDGDLVIYVPRESVDLYKNTRYWSEYADSYVGYDFEE